MKGKTQKEHWKRVICENGCYRLCKSENVKEFMKAEGLPEKMICMMDDFKIKWKVCDNRFDLVRCFGGMKIESGGCFDEELCEVAMEGIPASKYVVTKTGSGKYKSLVRDEKGGKAEWCMEFFEGGLCMVNHLTLTKCIYSRSNICLMIEIIKLFMALSKHFMNKILIIHEIRNGTTWG